MRPAKTSDSISNPMPILLILRLKSFIGNLFSLIAMNALIVGSISIIKGSKPPTA